MLQSAITGSHRVACSALESHGRCVLLLAWLRLLTAAGQRDRPATDPATRCPSPPACPLPSHSAPSTHRRLVSPARSPLAGERSAPACATFRLTPPLAATRLPPLVHATPEPRPYAPPQPSSVCAPQLPSPASALPQLRRPARCRCPRWPVRCSSHSHSRRSAPLAARARERRRWIGGVDG